MSHKEKKLVRKISVGKDYLNAMHFQVGSVANRSRDLKVVSIILTGDEFVVYAGKGDICQEWKCFSKNAVCHYELELKEI